MDEGTVLSPDLFRWLSGPDTFQQRWEAHRGPGLLVRQERGPVLLTGVNSGQSGVSYVCSLDSEPVSGRVPLSLRWSLGRDQGFGLGRLL